MLPVKPRVVIVLLAITLTGCGANQNSIFRSFSSETPHSVLIDAKQRGILTTSAESADFTNAEERKRSLFVCAEPSPDALSAISSTLSASAGGAFGPGETVQLALARAVSETASQLGKRNATIQLLRDGLYRQCEAYMNGLIGETYYEQIANKYANAMVTLLAIEELTRQGVKVMIAKAAEGHNVTASTGVTVSGGEASPEQSSPSGTEAGEPLPGEPQPTESDQAKAEGEQASGGEAQGSASAPVVNVNLPEASGDVAPHVSTAVNTMVTWFLTKDTVDYCLRGLLNGTKTIETANNSYDFEYFADVCSQVIMEQMTQQTQVASAYAITARGGTFGRDICSDAISYYWKPDGIRDQGRENEIRKAMEKSKIEISIPGLLNMAERADDRREVGMELNLENCK